MKKSATDVMQEILLSTVLDSIAALKEASKGLPNNLLRDLNAIHANTAQADLPAGLQSAIAASVRGAFSKLLREGYSVAPTSELRPVRPPRPDGPRPERPRGGPPRGGRPPRKPGPRPR
jgi:hypothetical protein